MSRTAMLLLVPAAALFVGLIAWQGFGSVAATLMNAGWGLLIVAVFHLIPLALDAAAIAVMFDQRDGHGTLREALLARWVGESVNSLLPAGQIGGPLAMVRHLVQSGARLRDAAAAITVSTTMQAVAQIAFALLGFVLFGAYAARAAITGSAGHALIATALLTFVMGIFYWAQRRGLFGRLSRIFAKLVGRRDWSALTTHADAVDAAVHALYRRSAKVGATFSLSLVGWIIGTGEVWLAMRLLGHPVGWLDALLLESLGQAIRGAAFAIPGALGAQEGGYLLLAPLVGVSPDAALGLSLAKRARELLLGLPGMIYLHWNERNWQRRAPQVSTAE
ncbi:MAG: TIGR00374 family protein [Proteobacteria bacterium]|nr:MAG: TIGR00374 family protein [Pseudomonadota bacterium]